MSQQNNLPEVSYKQAHTILNEKFTQFEPVLDVFYNSYERARKGGKPPYVIMFGPGGYGKTALSKILLKIFTGHAPRVQPMDSSTTPSQLFGGWDMEQMMSTGKMRELLHESVFVGAPSFVLEEGLQAPPATLNTLKYTLLEGIRCTGNECLMLDSVMGAIATNFDPREWAQTGENVQDALALLERFPLEVEVVWKDHSADAYLAALTKKYPKEPVTLLGTVAEIAGMVAEKGKPLSPRTVLDDFFPSFAINPIAAVDYTAAIPSSMRGTIRSKVKSLEEVARIRAMLAQAGKLAKINPNKIPAQELPVVLAAIKATLDLIESEPIKYDAPQNLYALQSTAVEELRKLQNAVTTRLGNPNKTVIDYEQIIKSYS